MEQGSNGLDTVFVKEEPLDPPQLVEVVIKEESFSSGGLFISDCLLFQEKLLLS